MFKIAFATACVRFTAFSLIHILLTWNLTVRSDIESICPMSQEDLPSINQESISFSRSVSWTFPTDKSDFCFLLFFSFINYIFNYFWRITGRWTLHSNNHDFKTVLLTIHINQQIIYKSLTNKLQTSFRWYPQRKLYSHLDSLHQNFIFTL